MFSLQIKSDFCEEIDDDFRGYFDENDPEDFSDEECGFDYENRAFSCESCERTFDTQFYFDKHMSEHRVCNIDGCQFTAHENVVEKHITIQHLTGLYERICHVNTPEDIARWIEERKKRYPKKENIAIRYEQQEELLKKGLRIGKNDNAFGRDKFRLSKNIQKQPRPPTIKSQHHKRKVAPKKKPEFKSIIDDKCDWNGTMFPFPGTSELYDEKETSDYEDDEWESNQKPEPSKIKLNNALGALMGAYGSDSDEEVLPQPSLVKKEPEEVVIKKCEDDDDEAPTEIKIEKLKPIEIVEEPKPIKATVTKRKRPVRRQKKNARKSFKATTDDNFKCAFRKRKVTLLEKLLEKEIRHERNTLLQCVRFVVSENFFMKDANV